MSERRDDRRGLDLRALGRGAAVAAAIAVPAGVIQNLIGRDSNLSFFLFFVVVIGLVAGGFVAGREVPRRALTHGGLAAMTVYLGVQGIGIGLRLARGERVTWLAIPLIALLSASCGTIGGYLAFRRSVGSEGSEGSENDASDTRRSATGSKYGSDNGSDNGIGGGQRT